MSYYEIIRGDGEEVFCQSIGLGDLGKFGNNTFNKKIDLKGKKWVRFEAWDIATNGVLFQPIWLK